MKSWYNMLFGGVNFILVGALVTELDPAKVGEPYFRVLNFDRPVLPGKWHDWTETFTECKALPKGQNAPDLVTIGPCFTSGAGINEVFEDLMSTGKEADKKLAGNYRSRMFYIVKVIDRDAEEDGVKFWRFKHNYKNEGVLDKIFPIWKLQTNCLTISLKILVK